MSRMYMSPIISVVSLRPSLSKMAGWLEAPATMSRSAVGL